MNHDPEIFPEPNEFRPERWLELSPRKLQLHSDGSDELVPGPGVNNVWFGFGRRSARLSPSSHSETNNNGCHYVEYA